MRRVLLIAATIILGGLGVVAAITAVNSIVGLATLGGQSPNMGFSLLLPIAIIAGVIAAGCGVGVAVCMRALGRRTS